MTNTILQTSNTAQLNAYFTQLVSNLMVIEKQPLKQLTSQRDTINIQHGAYLDAMSRLQSFQSAVTPLTTTSASTVLKSATTASVSGAPTGLTVLSATSDSTAIPGAYSVSVTTLAREQRVRSDQQAYSDQALNLTGQILLGGAAARGQTTLATSANTVTGFGTATLAASHTELGSGTYYVETRNDATNGWQFRLVDANGQAMTVATTDGSSDTNNWQAIPAGGSYDTGRGLTLNLGTDSSQYIAADRNTGAASVSYTAQGASINVTAGQSLNDIATAINGATYADGSGVIATVVDRQLILSAAQTGTQHGVVAADATGTVLQSLGLITGTGAFKNEIQSASDATFSVNGVPVKRGTNTGLTDVISGVTLNLAKDAQGQSATLTVSQDTSAVSQGIQSFISQFNTVQSYLSAETQVQKSTAADGSPRYTPATLSNDTVFSDLRMNLFDALGAQTTGGAFKSLFDLGLSIDGSMQLSISDSSKLNAALANNPNDVNQLLNQVMGGFNTLLNQFTAPSTGYLANAATGLSQQLTADNSRIADLTNQLNNRQQDLSNQYADIQAQLAQLSYNQQMWQSIYNASTGSTTTLA
jgi:flagellar hook-associated protein 2